AMSKKYCGLLVVFSFLVPCPSFSQSQKIEIIGADALKMDTLHRARKLTGNVRLKQNDILMSCDSALFYNYVNAVDAFGRVFIHDAQTKVYSDSLKYDGERKIATLFGNVRVMQDSATLETSKMIYNTELKQAAYDDGGKVIARGMTITSKRGYYFTSAKDAHFKGAVTVKGKDYEVHTDTLVYNTEAEIAHFYGPAEIYRPKEKIYCESGWYDTNTEISVFGKNTRLSSEAQRIWADSLYYDNRKGFGQAYKNFRWTDTTMDVILSGNRAVYYTQQQRITATDSALLTYLVDDDSLFLSADTLRSREDTIADVTEFFAYPRVRIFKSSLQGVCDSLVFSYRDSAIMMYKNPVLWNDVNQLTGDTISIQLRHEKIDRVELYENGFIASKAHGELFNQIKGRHIYGYFKDKKLDRLLAEGNGESIYYGTDENEAFIGVNRAACSSMWIYLKDEHVSRITFLTQPDAAFYPIQYVAPKDFLLKGFEWKEELRPRSKADLFATLR
ncbi:MAG TPA: OstA-like protein, partial [Chitinophagales bacterium]|nr:OstA-like protein [Chitinophagales bacterium]